MIDEKKLIERLKRNAFSLTYNFVVEKYLKFDKAIEIVGELTEEEEHKGGWIPCERGLPETNESVLCWAKSTARGGDVCFVGSCHNGFWFLQSSADTHSFPGQYVVVAWQPLPEPYRQEGEGV